MGFMSVKTFLVVFLFATLASATSCDSQSDGASEREQATQDSLERVNEEQLAKEEEERNRPRIADDIDLRKELTYDQHTLDDSYPYKDTTRLFQWDKIKEHLAHIENFQREDITYVVLENYKNKNRESPVVKNFVRNSYTRVSDTLGVERYQSAPLYAEGETKSPTIYGRDGSLAKLLSSDTVDMVQVEGISFDGVWDVPKRYTKTIGDSIRFEHIVFVDVTNQNICAVERADDGWLVRSMNPATSGQHNPPYAQETPVGIFVIQENKPKMYYYKDGTTSIGGFAPYASRFTNGAYIHGIPINAPNKNIVEYSPTLGTVPRSHMCVRNASSHAKFIYEWAKPLHSLVIVID